MTYHEHKHKHCIFVPTPGTFLHPGYQDACKGQYEELTRITSILVPLGHLLHATRGCCFLLFVFFCYKRSGSARLSLRISWPFRFRLQLRRKCLSPRISSALTHPPVADNNSIKHGPRRAAGCSEW